MVRDLLHHLDTHKSMGPEGIHPRALRKLAEVLAKPLSIIYQQSWLTGEVPVDWRLANVMPLHKKGRKEDLGNSRPVSLTLVPGKVIEQIILSAIMQHIVLGLRGKVMVVGKYRSDFCEKLLEATDRANASWLQNRPTTGQGRAHQ
ncbi:mitochondrial enolase superfamily member 1 [Grus japonensis]|uniref:Mitochondrial enolase superfamily member 1 n=1 Tax=Grus japonensis TaxID=30415 RepID=A0ABC9W9Y8_GRUJA